MLLLGVRGYKLNFLADQFPTHLAHLYSCGGQTILGAHHYQAREGDMLPPSVQRAEGVGSESQLFCGPFFFFFSISSPWNPPGVCYCNGAQQ